MSSYEDETGVKLIIIIIIINDCVSSHNLFIYFIDLSQTSLHSNYTFQIDASKNITI